MRLLNIFNLSILAILLSGCLESSSTSTYNYTNNTKPYTVNGKTYYPMSTSAAVGFTETGEASWYGPSFHGKKTSSGEIYNQYAYTAAHKTLPFGTKLRVTNLGNGLSTTVVVNDRGPFKDGRIIDLSNSAAKDISMIGTGTARVRITAIGSTTSSSIAQSSKSYDIASNVSTKTSTATATSASVYTGQNVSQNTGNYYVQIGSFSVYNNADSAAKNLLSNGYKSVIRQSGDRYTVVAGPYATRTSAESARDNLQATYSGAFIVQ